MKKLLLTFALVVAAGAAFAQGKVTLQNDAGSAITFTGNAGLMVQSDANASLTGAAVPTGPLPSGQFLVFGLYGATGAGATTLNLLGSVALNTAAGTGIQAGLISPSHLVLPFEGGTVDTFQIRVWDNRYASYEAAAAVGNGYLGESAVFNMTPGLSSKLPYPGINNGGGSTLPGSAIIVSLVPEPSTFALAGLGAAAMLIFRRRK